MNDEDENSKFDFESDEEEHGILSKYTHQQAISPEQVMVQDFRRVRKQTEKELASTYAVTNNTEQMIETTKHLLTAKRFERHLGTGEKYKKQRVQKEYMNYGKYKENYITREDEYNPIDTGKYNLTKHNYRESMKRTNTMNSEDIEQEDKEIIDEAFQLNNRGSRLMGDEYLQDFTALYENMNYDVHKNITEQDLRNKYGFQPEEMDRDQFHPILSPDARDRIYIDWQKGMALKDISLKYGVLKERALAVIYQCEYYYKVLYPKIGETTARLLQVIEYEYEEEYECMDYGIDIPLMAHNEQGGPMMHIHRTPVDTHPSTDVRK